MDDALADLQEWWDALLSAVRESVPRAWDWVVDHGAELEPVDFKRAVREAKSDTLKLAMIVARDIACRCVLKLDDGGLRRELPGDGPRWTFIHQVAVEAGRQAVLAPAVKRWVDVVPGNRQVRRTFVMRQRVAHAFRTARPGEPRADTLRRAGVSRSRGYEIMKLLGLSDGG